MLDTPADTAVKNYLAAVRRAIDPHRTMLATSTPYVVAGSIGPAGRKAIVAGMSAADTVGADFIHLEFEPGAERNGPVNVAIGMFRCDVGHVWERCRFWLAEDGQMMLVAPYGSEPATMTFDADGTDSHPGMPKGDLEGGFHRAAERLRQIAASPSPAHDVVKIRLSRVA